MRPLPSQTLAAVRTMRGHLHDANERLSTRPTRRAIGDAAGPLAAAMAVAAEVTRPGSPGLDRPAGEGGPMWGRRADAGDAEPCPPNRRGVSAAVRELRRSIAEALESLDAIATAADPWDALDAAAFDVARALAVAAAFAPVGTPGLDAPFGDGGPRWGRNQFAGGSIPADAPIVYFVTPFYPDGSRGEPWPTTRRAAIRRERAMRREMGDLLIVMRRGPDGLRRVI